MDPQRLAYMINYKLSFFWVLTQGTAEETYFQADGQGLFQVPTANSLVKWN